MDETVPIPAQHLTADGERDVALAADILRNGGLVAMPTETVYGLAANALDNDAVERIFAAKERPHWDPLIVHICDGTMLLRVVREVSVTAQKLMEQIWPGPLTLLLPRHPKLPDAVTAGRDLVGVRMPAHPAARALIRAAALPLAAPSANRFGHISPTTAQHVLADLEGRIDAVLDGGPCSVGVESTVFDPAEGIIYRHGSVSAEELQSITGAPVRSYNPPPIAGQQTSQLASLPSPGVGIRHYAPRARVLLVETEDDLRFVAKHSPHRRIAIMLPSDWSVPGFSGAFYRWSAWNDPAGLAQTLYAGLRTLDAAGVATIICPLPSGDDALSQALRERLRKAACD